MRYRISVSEAQQLVLSHATPVEVVRLPHPRSLGRTLRAPVYAADDLPAFDNSAMDGFAVRWKDCQALPVTLRVAETITAGQLPSKALQENACAAILTGAPMPTGADTVVPIEWTEEAAPSQVRIGRAPAQGTYVRRTGQDASKGDRVCEAGVVITPPVLGMIAAAGVDEVMVSSLPRIAVVTTGDEIHTTPGRLPRGKIRDISGVALAAQATAAGATPIGPFHARDHVSSIQQAIEAALEKSDLLLVAGGVSVGERDLVKAVLDDMGLTMQFWRVRQRPGGPLAFGLLGGRAVFGLPGNPVSSAVCFDQYVRPFVAAMLGRNQLRRPRLRAVLSKDTPKKSGLHFFSRGVYCSGADGRLMVRDTGPQASNLYSSLVRANCIIHLEEEVTAARAGATVEIEPFSWPIG